MGDLVTFTVQDGVADVRLNRPDKLNSLTLPLLKELVSVGRTLRADRGLRAVIISGEGDSFCAGLDFGSVVKDPIGIVRAFTPIPWRGTNTFQEACWVWRRVPVPVIAVVHGHCFGGGIQLAMAADFRFSTPDAQWSVLEAKWGLIPDMTGIKSLAEQVGMDTAKRLTMTVAVLSGEEAASLGLVTAVSADPRAEANKLIDQLKTRSPDSVAAAKRLFNRTWSASPRRTFARERAEQLVLLTLANTRAAREAAFKREQPTYGARRFR